MAKAQEEKAHLWNSQGYQIVEPHSKETFLNKRIIHGHWMGIKISGSREEGCVINGSMGMLRDRLFCSVYIRPDLMNRDDISKP